MKTLRIFPVATALSLIACMRTQAADSPQPPEIPNQPITGVAVPPTTVAVDVSSAQWSDFKGFGYDMREQVFAGLKALEAKVDAQVIDLNTKREALVASNTSTQAWDLNMQEMVTTRTALKSAAADLNDASRDNWDQMKDRVTDAWTRTQDAYTKVRASTTK